MMTTFDHLNIASKEIASTAVITNSQVLDIHGVQMKKGWSLGKEICGTVDVVSRLSYHNSGTIQKWHRRCKP